VILLAPTADDTRALGEALGRLLPPGAVVLLRGPLGAGKTTFVQGLAEGMGVAERVVSPTFVLVREHPGPPGEPGLAHVDCYRLAGPADVRALALDEWLDAGGVVAVEWPDRGRDALPADVVEVELAYAGDGRRVRLTATGPRSRAALAGLEPPPALAGAPPTGDVR